MRAWSVWMTITVLLLVVAAAYVDAQQDDEIDKIHRRLDRSEAEVRRLERESRVTRRVVCGMADTVGYDGPPVRC